MRQAFAYTDPEPDPSLARVDGALRTQRANLPLSRLRERVGVRVLDQAKFA